MPHAARSLPAWLIFDVGQKSNGINVTSSIFCMNAYAFLNRGCLVLAFSSTICVSQLIAQPLPKAVEQLSREPIAVSGGGSGRGGKSFDIPPGQAAVIENDELVCLLELHDVGPNKRTYTFRTFHKPSGYEISGEGEVFEHYYQISRPGQTTRVVDRGSVLFVDAGFLKIRWSLGRWLYYDPNVASVTSGSKAEYEAKIEPYRRKP